MREEIVRTIRLTIIVIAICFLGDKMLDKDIQELYITWDKIGLEMSEAFYSQTK